MSPAPQISPALLPLLVAGRNLQIEWQWLQPERQAAGPTLVFLHEGLGSIAMWRQFPQRLCAQLGLRGLVYSRPGYGQSTPRAPDEHWQPDYLDHQAEQVLPALRAALGLQSPVWLIGHSDGATIALLHAARFPEQVAGIVLMAPHIDVEDKAIAGIEAAVQAYQQGDLRARLARYHADVNSAFGGWAGAWLSPAFRSWNIHARAATLRCPVLAIQGEGDEYGTLAQIDGIAAAAPQTQCLALPDCGHSPHLAQPDVVIAAITRFVQSPTPA